MSLFDSAWAQLGAVGLLAGVVAAIVLGKLVPLATLRREVAAEMRRADDLKLIQQEQARQLDELVQITKETNRLVANLGRVAREPA